MLLTEEQLAAIEPRAPLITAAYRELKGRIERYGVELDQYKKACETLKLNLASAELEVKRLLQADKKNTESLIRLVKANKNDEGQLAVVKTSRDAALKTIAQLQKDLAAAHAEIRRLASL